MANDVLKLPNYPSTSARKSLSPSQLATLNQAVASTLASVLALPNGKRDIPSTRNFLSSYAKDAAFQTLQSLIWKEDAAAGSTAPRTSSDEKLIQKRSLQLAEKLASSSPGLDVQSLLDLSVIYSHQHPSRLRQVFKASFETNPSLNKVISDDLVPGFTSLLSQSQGLYAQRKLAECICSFLRGAKGSLELIRPFARSKTFLVALASAYDAGMAATAASYGGIPALTSGISGQDREADDWERIWVETKVALLDAFHIVLTTLLDDLASCPNGPRLAVEAERTFDIIFALLEAPSSSSTGEAVPFLNQSLLADYQHSYSLSHTLATALKHAQEKDARLDLLESTLQSFDRDTQNYDFNDNDKKTRKPKNAGALKILLRSSGVQPGIDNLGTRTSQPQSHPGPTLSNDFDFQLSNNDNDKDKDKGKGKGKSRPSVPDPDLDLKTTQVLDILPDTPSEHVRLLLAHDRYGRDPEKVVEALLEGTAMSQEELEMELERNLGLGLMPREEWDGDVHVRPEVRDGRGKDFAADHEGYNVEQRRNVFDDEVLDVAMLRFGKKSAGEEVLQDRTFIEEMKADILRRAEAISDDEDEDDGGGLDAYGTGTETQTASAKKKGKGKAKEVTPAQHPRGIDMGPDEDEEDVIGVRVVGDGEDSDVDDDVDVDDNEDEDGAEDEGGEGEIEAQTPETIVELAYLRDPKVFERDAVTRRSKARIDLRSQTGWDDGQIEGWKVMLDRNPGRKDKLMEKHAFRGNEKGLQVHAGGSGSGGGRGRGGRGRGGPSRGGGRGRGGGGGGGGRGGGGGSGSGLGGGAGGGEASARERAWKDKNKASRGNHNRKRGHDKKMARAGAGPST